MTSRQEKYEEAMNEVGGFGWFQKKLCVLLTLSTIPNGYFAMAIVFVAANPAHRCFIPSVDNHTGHLYANNKTENMFRYPNIASDIPYGNETELMKHFSKCEMFNQSGVGIHECQNGWVFDLEEGRTSIVTEYQLICGRSWIRPLLTTIYMLGVLIGALVSGSMADILGRKPTFLIGTLLQFVFLGLSGASNGPAMYAAMMFGAGAFAYVNYVTAFIIAAEMINTKDRVVTGVLAVGGFAGGYMLLPVFAYFIPDWRILTYVLSALGVVFIPYIWFMPESPRWLYSKNKNVEFEKLFRQIAKSNNISEIKVDQILGDLFVDKEDEEMAKSLTASIKEEEPKSNVDDVEYTYVDLVRTNAVRFRTVNMWIIWFICALVYFCLGLNTSNIGGDPYINCFIAAAVEIPAYAFTIVALKWKGRKMVLISTLLLAGVSCSTVPYLQRRGFVISSITVAMVGKLAVSAAFCVVYIFCSELYPTLMRSRGMGSASMAARIGGMVAPYLLYMGERYYAAPYLLMGTLSVVAAIVTSILPETQSKIVPNTVDDLRKLHFRRFKKLNLEKITWWKREGSIA